MSRLIAAESRCAKLDSECVVHLVVWQRSDDKMPRRISDNSADLRSRGATANNLHA
jgi:hypothetical protein